MNNLYAGKASRLLERRDSNLAPQLRRLLRTSHRSKVDGNSLPKSTFLSTRNKCATNVSVIAKVQTTNESKILRHPIN